MAAPSGGGTTPVQWSIPWLHVAGLNVPSARLEVELFAATTLAGRKLVSDQAWLDTGAPLSVIPHHSHHGRIAWRIVPGVTVNWAGQICDLGHVDIWLPTSQSRSPRGPFEILAKFPRSDPPGISVPILLGLELFLALKTGMSLPAPPQPGEIQVP